MTDIAKMILCFLGKGGAGHRKYVYCTAFCELYEAKCPCLERDSSNQRATL